MNDLEYSLFLIEEEFYEVINWSDNPAYIFRLVSEYKILEELLGR